jgi:polyisoprenoid-binding protein YceI
LKTILSLFLILFTSSAILAEQCKFDYDPAATKLTWKAFKFSARTGVEGSFDTFSVTEKIEGKTAVELAGKIKFKIDVNSVNTKNPERDVKIKSAFFGTMKNTKEITGSFRNIKLKGEIGTADLVLKMNGVEKTNPVTFSLKEGKNIELKTTLDVFKWGAQNSIETLNKICSERHTDKDGVSKLWNDVEIIITSTFKSTCK